MAQPWRYPSGPAERLPLLQPGEGSQNLGLSLLRPPRSLQSPADVGGGGTPKERRREEGAQVRRCCTPRGAGGAHCPREGRGVSHRWDLSWAIAAARGVVAGVSRLRRSGSNPSAGCPCVTPCRWVEPTGKPRSACKENRSLFPSPRFRAPNFPPACLCPDLRKRHNLARSPFSRSFPFTKQM